MKSPSQEFDVLLSAPSPVEAQMAQALLEEHGIPSMLHGMDRDLAELGYAVHAGVSRPDLYVPKGESDRALSILKATWDKAALEEARPDESWDTPEVLRKSERAAERASHTSTKDLVIWIAFLVAVAAIVATVVLDHLSSRG